MSVLARESILEAIEKKEIIIEPFDPSSVGCASIDLTLSNEFRFYKPGLTVVPVRENTDYKELTEKVVLEEGETYLLLPGCACLGITRETVKLGPGICGLLEGRSRFARLGLFVHITAGFMNPGIQNRQVLEIYNASNHALALVPGEKVCQFIFMRMEGQAQYTGRFAVNEL
jgi:dCTP deaminase